MKTKIIEIIKRTNLAKHKGFTDSIFIIVDYQVPKEWNKKKKIKILTKNSTITQNTQSNNIIITLKNNKQKSK